MSYRTQENTGMDVPVLDVVVDATDKYGVEKSKLLAENALAGTRRDNVILTAKENFPLARGARNPDLARPSTSSMNPCHLLLAYKSNLRRLDNGWTDERVLPGAKVCSKASRWRPSDLPPACRGRFA